MLRASRARPCLVGQATQRVDRGHDDALPVGVAEVEQDAEVAALDALDDLGGRLVPALGRRRVTRARSRNPAASPSATSRAVSSGRNPRNTALKSTETSSISSGWWIALDGTTRNRPSSAIARRASVMVCSTLATSWNTHTATMFVTDAVAIGSAMTSPSAIRAPSLPCAMANIFGERSTPTTA